MTRTISGKTLGLGAVALAAALLGPGLVRAAAGEDDAPPAEPAGEADDKGDGGGADAKPASDSEDGPTRPGSREVLPEGWLDMGPGESRTYRDDSTGNLPPGPVEDTPPTPAPAPSTDRTTVEPPAYDRAPRDDGDDNLWDNDEIRLGVFVGAFIPSGDLKLEGAPAIDARLAIRLGRSSSVLVGFSFGFASFEISERDDVNIGRAEIEADVQVTRYDLEVIFELAGGEKGGGGADNLVIQCMTGFGLTAFTNFPDDRDAVDPGVLFGVGMKYFLTDYLAIGLEARLRLIYTRFRVDHNFVALDFDPRAGISLHF